jgi:hypothetical protein
MPGERFASIEARHHRSMAENGSDFGGGVASFFVLPPVLKMPQKMASPSALGVEQSARSRVSP